MKRNIIWFSIFAGSNVAFIIGLAILMQPFFDRTWNDYSLPLLLWYVILGSIGLIVILILYLKNLWKN